MSRQKSLANVSVVGVMFYCNDSVHKRVKKKKKGKNVRRWAPLVSYIYIFYIRRSIVFIKTYFFQGFDCLRIFYGRDFVFDISLFKDLNFKHSMCSIQCLSYGNSAPFSIQYIETMENRKNRFLYIPRPVTFSRFSVLKIKGFIRRFRDDKRCSYYASLYLSFSLRILYSLAPLRKNMYCSGTYITIYTYIYIYLIYLHVLYNIHKDIYI